MKEGISHTPRTGEAKMMQPTSELDQPSTAIAKWMRRPTLPHLPQPSPERLGLFLLQKIVNEMAWKPANCFDATELQFETLIRAAETNV
jgi:hypothetical protein